MALRFVGGALYAARLQTGSRLGCVTNSESLRRDRRDAVFLFVAVHETAFGTKQTWASALHMSAFGGKADMPIALRNVR
jgi:hypothetical protein